MIAFATRLLILLLMLSSMGVLPTIGRLAHADGDENAVATPQHADGDDGSCGNCSSDCAICICCPLRAAPAMRVSTGAPGGLDPQSVALGERVRVLPGITADIFHPPRV